MQVLSVLWYQLMHYIPAKITMQIYTPISPIKVINSSVNYCFSLITSIKLILIVCLTKNKKDCFMKKLLTGVTLILIASPYNMSAETVTLDPVKVNKENEMRKLREVKEKQANVPVHVVEPGQLSKETEVQATRSETPRKGV